MSDVDSRPDRINFYWKMISSNFGWSSFTSPSTPTSPWQICQGLGQMLDSSNGAQLVDVFRNAVDEIFSVDSVGFGFGSASFTLLTITPTCASDFQAYYDLLNINGPIFRAIDRLMAEPSLRYQTQVRDHSTASRVAFDQSSNGQTQANVADLNAFQYYFFQFAQHLLHSAAVYPHGEFDYLDCVYVKLLSDYLSGFLPPDGIYPANVSSSAIGSSSNKQPWESDRYLIDDQRFSPIRGSPFGLLRRELFRENGVANSNFNHSQTTRSIDVISKSIAFVSILLDSWLGDPSSWSGSRPSTQTTFGSLSGLNGKTFNSTISSVVAVANKLLVEHLHNFVYGPSSSVIDAQFRNFKERQVPRLLDGRMWVYLQHAFDRWPLDSSFRFLMELWLAFIQPWRYAYRRNQGAEPDRTYDGQWELFVREHIGFYTTFFQLACERFLRMDLCSYKAAVALYRLSTVFGQVGLVDVLGWSNRDLSLCGRLNVGVRSLAISQIVTAVTERSQKASKFCEQSIVDQNEALRKRSWPHSIMNSLFGDVPDDSTLAELSHTRDCLEATVHNFETAFGFRLTEEMITGELSRDYTSHSHLDTTREPESRMTDDGHLRLTPLGRRQVLNANRRFDLSRVAYPRDLTPIDASCEFWPLARLLQMISSKLNAKYGKKLGILYGQPHGVTPWILNKILAPPTRSTRKNSPVLERKPTDLGARINLRPLASYRFLLTLIFLLFLLSVIFGFRAVAVGGFLFQMIFLGLIYYVFNYHPAVRYVD